MPSDRVVICGAASWHCLAKVTIVQSLALENQSDVDLLRIFGKLASDDGNRNLKKSFMEMIHV